MSLPIWLDLFADLLLLFPRLRLKDDRSLASDPTIAWACIRLDRLQTGYRLLHLIDPEGVPSKGFLLVHITKSLA